MSTFVLSRRRSVTRAAVIVSAALLLLTTVMVGTSAGHGSAIDPPSRHYGCWERWGSDFQNPEMANLDPMCWQAWQADVNAMWNWNGLYREGVGGDHQGAIPDGTLCSGGLTGDGRYAAMDEPGPWTAAQVDNNFTLRIQDQATHGADYYRVYVTEQGFDPLTDELGWGDLELVTDTGVIPPGVGEPADPGVIVSIDVNAPGRTGRHIVYTIWQASHFDQSFYMCSDVIFPGGPDPTSSPTPPPSPSLPPSPSPSPTTSPTPPPSSSTAPAPDGDCAATYTQLNEWPGGFQGEVTVTAGETISGWSVTLTFAEGQAITQYWSAQLSGTGPAYTAGNVAYNGSLAAGQSTNFGFLGSWNGSNSPPSLSCTAT
jgi:predicted carbohydrate-binding protein with CBM5 and CBM33 domain